MQADGGSAVGASRLRVGVRLPPYDRVDRVAEMAQRAERLGFDHVWCPDSQLLWRDPFVALSAIATRTSSIGLGVAVTNTVTRHPSVVAASARTVSELAPGRFKLGLGVGDSAVRPIGLRRPTIAAFRERVELIRTLIAGREADIGGNSARLYGEPSRCPIYVAASGPRALELAGGVGDGVILLSGVSPETLRTSLARVASGAEAGGRQLRDLDVVVATFCRVTDDLERDARELKPICLTIAQNGGDAALAVAGIELRDAPRVDAYPDLFHAENWDEAVEKTNPWVSDADAMRFAEAFCLYGSPERIAERIEAAAAIGVRSLFLQHVGSYSFPTELMEVFAGDVAPILSQKGIAA